MDISNDFYGSDDDNGTPPESIHMAQTATENLLTTKSKQKYESVYKAFMEWHYRKKADGYSENVILAYFVELSDKLKASSLWTQYSMLRGTLEIRHNIKLNTYAKLRAFLKRKSHGYQAKKAKTLTNEQINMFIENADDQKYLATKVALIMGIVGACMCSELKEMNIENVQDLTSALLVNVPNTKTQVLRSFTITGSFYEIVKKYISLRPPECSAFFLTYQNGKCTTQQMGINKFSMMGKQIATFLNLPNPELYTGHTLRRSSVSLLMDAGGNPCLERIMSRRSFRLVQQQTNEGVDATAVSRFSERRLSEEENGNSSNIQQHINDDDMPLIPETLLGIDLDDALPSEVEAQNKSEERKSITLEKSFARMEKLMYTMKTDVNNLKSQIVTKESMRKMKTEIVQEIEDSMREMKAEIVNETEEAMRKVIREELQWSIKKEVSECMGTNFFAAAESCLAQISE